LQPLLPLLPLLPLSLLQLLLLGTAAENACREDGRALAVVFAAREARRSDDDGLVAAVSAHDGRGRRG
jgi:hypothetical protein